MASVNYTYVYFTATDFSGRDTLSAYTLPQNKLTFVPDFLTSPVLSSESSISNKVLRWDFGDGTYSRDLTPTHYYKWPGDYKVRLTVYDKFGNGYDSSYRPTIKVYDFIRDQLFFNNYKRFIYNVLAGRIFEPIEIIRQTSWQSYNALSSTGYTINLYASGALGQYQNTDNFYNDKWSHLRALSRFYIKNPIGDFFEYLPVNKITNVGEEIYAKTYGNTFRICNKTDIGSFFVGTTASNQIYYVDDVPKNYSSEDTPIILFATLDNSKFPDRYTIYNDSYKEINYPPYGYNNISPAVLPTVKVRFNPAERLSITTTGIDGEGTLSTTKFYFPQLSWQNSEIPFLIKMKDTDNFTTKSYPPIYSSVTDISLSALKDFNLIFGLQRKEGNNFYPVTAVQFFEDFNSDIPRSIGAFFKGYFIVNQPTYNLQLTARMDIVDPLNYPKDAFLGWAAVPQYDVLVRIFKEKIYSSCLGEASVSISASKNFFFNYDNRNIYAIQVAPSGAGIGNDYQTWFADGSRDSIIKFTAEGVLLSSFTLSAYPLLLSATGLTDYVNLLNPILSSAAPASLTLDGNSDVWFCLADAISSIKIDGKTGFLIANAYPDVRNICYFLSDDYHLPFLSGFAGENLVYPVSIDADFNNDIWVSYTHPVCGFICKYSTYGSLLCVVPFPPLHSPAEIIIDRYQNLWVTAYNLAASGFTLSGRNDYLYKFNTRGDLTSGYPISGFKFIHNATTDLRQNLWVAQDRDTITRIDANDGSTSNYIAGSANFTSYIGSIGGIACDTNNTLWVINNIDQKLYFIDTLVPKVSSVNYLESVDLVLPGQSPTNILSTFAEKSFQAYGDWLGARWINKFLPTQPRTLSRTITGESNFFNILPLSGEYSILKINENFNASGFYRSLIFSEVMEDKFNLFNNFIGTIVGSISAQPYELGKTVYEKIANFVNNKSDIDKCNLDSLLSFCKELSIQFEQYNYPFPPQLTRLINLLSIKHSNLWGTQNKFNLDFSKKGTQFNQNYAKNRGNELSTVNSYITAGTPVVAYETFSGLYSLINTVIIPGKNYGNLIPLSTYSYDWGWGLVAPMKLSGYRIADFYKFYEFIEVYDNNYYNNIIDWENQLTTLTYNNSTFNEWTKNNGIMESLINYEITKGLRLILSASDIVYNN